jgi:hypothetical protein
MHFDCACTRQRSSTGKGDNTTMGTNQTQSGHTFCNLRKSAKPLGFCGRSRRNGESKTLFQTSTVQRQKWEKPTTSALFGQRSRSNQVEKRGHVKDTITMTKGVSGC